MNSSRSVTTAVHNIPPVFDAGSTILILGSFPSVKSRSEAFFYAHPQNRFWTVLETVFEDESDLRSASIQEKKEFLHRHHIALWDVIASCEITGSSDSSIRNAVPNDLTPLLAAADIRTIYCNGGTAYRLFRTYQEPVIGRSAVRLPSTSPANAAYSLPRLLSEWRILGETQSQTARP